MEVLLFKSENTLLSHQCKEIHNGNSYQYMYSTWNRTEMPEQYTCKCILFVIYSVAVLDPRRMQLMNLSIDQNRYQLKSVDNN